MAAAGTHADREIGNQADAHAGVARGLLHGREAARREPLREHVELDRTRFAVREIAATAAASGVRHSAGQSLQLHVGSSAPNQC